MAMQKIHQFYNCVNNIFSLIRERFRKSYSAIGHLQTDNQLINKTAKYSINRKSNHS